MASHKIAIEFVHPTTNGEKDIIHTYAYWDGRRSADTRTKAIIDAVATALAPPCLQHLRRTLRRRRLPLHRRLPPQQNALGNLHHHQLRLRKKH